MVKLWAVKKNSFTHLRSIKIPKCGFINVMKWTEKGDKIICGIGTEHRLGRWEHINGAKNGIAIIKLPINCMDDDVKEDDSNKQIDKDEDEEDDNNNEIKYEDAVTWDKWNPKERGEYISDEERKDADDIDDKTKDSVKSFVEDDEDDDEWTSFFGNVFR